MLVKPRSHCELAELGSDLSPREGALAMGDIDLTERIRQRAYEIWESEGQPHGRNLIHWMRAEAETIRDPLQAQAATEELRTPTRKPPRKCAPSSATSPQGSKR
jgi:hypothetical protein